MTDEIKQIIEAEKNAPPVYVPPVPISVGQGGTTKNISVETCRKTLVNANNTALNT